MESFKQILEYIKTDFEINNDILGKKPIIPLTEEEKKFQEEGKLPSHEQIKEVDMDFIKLFHQEFNKYQEKITGNMDFLDEEGFKQKTSISLWFKVKREHENFQKCKNNLYALLCISQDIMGNEMLKGLNGMNADNMHEYLEKMLGDVENSPLSELFKNSPLGDILNNPELKEMITGFMDKIKNIDMDKIMKSIQSGDIGELSKMAQELGLTSGGANNPLGSAMNLLGGLMGGDAEEAALANLTPQQRAKLRREKAKTEYRRKIRAQEKEKERKRKARGNRKKRGGRRRPNGGSV